MVFTLHTLKPIRMLAINEFCGFWLAKIPRLIIHNQQWLTKFGRVICDIQKITSLVQGNREKKGRQPRGTGEGVALLGEAVNTLPNFYCYIKCLSAKRARAEPHS